MICFDLKASDSPLGYVETISLFALPKSLEESVAYRQ